MFNPFNFRGSQKKNDKKWINSEKQWINNYDYCRN